MLAQLHVQKVLQFVIRVVADSGHMKEHPREGIQPGDREKTPPS
jgi:hypothetical protein